MLSLIEQIERRLIILEKVTPPTTEAEWEMQVELRGIVFDQIHQLELVLQALQQRNFKLSKMPAKENLSVKVVQSDMSK